jgi:hypothetical protein
MKKSAILALIYLSPMFAEDKNATIFRSICFSNICIADDLDKVIQAQPHWLTAHLKTSDDDRGVVHLRDLSAVRKRYVDTIGRSYHGLSTTDLERLSESLLDSGYTGEPQPYTRLMDTLARDRVPFLVADSSVLPILKKATICGQLLVHGVFVSESGLYTGILMSPVGGKLSVVQIKRLFDLHIPADAPEVSKEQIIFDRVADLVKQIDAKYGTHWNTSESGSVQNESRAVGDDLEASLTLDRNSRGRRQREIEPMMTLSRRDFDTGVWQSLEWPADTKGCEVKAKAVVIE